MQGPLPSPEPYILYADDDVDDQLILRDTIRTVNPSLTLLCFDDGREAVSYLEQLPAGWRLPSAIILDLNMPGWGGLRTLEAIKTNGVLRTVPTYIFSTSDHPKHRAAALALGAKGYFTKPHLRKDLLELSERFAVHANDKSAFKQIIG